MSASVDRARDPDAQARHDAALATLAAVFFRLPERRRWRCSFAEAGDGSAWYEGVVVAGERDEAGAWMLDAEGELILVHGCHCHVEVL